MNNASMRIIRNHEGAATSLTRGRIALAVEPDVLVSRRFVRLVAASLALETAAAVVISTAVFATAALVARPGLDKCAVHTEVFAGESVQFVGYFEHMVEQLNDRVM